METMRREGYEFQVSRPRIIPREGPNGERLEPYEELMIDGPEGYLGVVMEKLGPRRATLLDVKNPGLGTVRMRFKVPARGCWGTGPEFLTDTRGNGIMHHRFFEYGPGRGRSRAGAGGHGGGPGGSGGRIRPLQSSGAGHPVHQAWGSGLRRDDCRGERPHRATWM